MKNHAAFKTKQDVLIPTDKLENHFKDHFKSRPLSVPDEVDNPGNYPHLKPPDELEVVSEGTPEAEEVKKVIKRMKNGKCKGSDNIYAEQIKSNTSATLISLIIMLLTLVWNVLTTPKSWLHSILTCLYKNKGNKMDPSNYRGLSITATLSKVFTAVIIERLKPVYEAILMPNQFCFRSNKSTTDAIYVLRNIIDNSSDELYCCFLDLKAAYDWINRDILFKVLEYRTGLPTLVKLLKCIYVGTTAAIRYSDRAFATISGCRQGGLESPCLFNIFLDFVMRWALHKIKEAITDAGVEIQYAIPSQCSTRSQRMEFPLRGDTRITHLSYADDIVFFCKTQEELQRMLTILDEEFNRFGLMISPSKTKTMSFNTPTDVSIPESLVTIRDIAIENVTSFCYLGHVISSEEQDHSALVIQRIASAHSKFNDLKQVLTDRRIWLKTRVKFLTACVRSRLTFSVQACLLKAAELNKLESVWTTFLRKLIHKGFERINIPPSRRRRGSRRSRRSENDTEEIETDEDLDWRFLYNNEKVYQMTNSDLIRTYCQIQHLKYIAHITRLPNYSLQKQTLFRTNKRRYARDPWVKYEEITNIPKVQLQKEMQYKLRFPPLLETILGTQHATNV